jgi:hypothetical protein
MKNVNKILMVVSFFAIVILLIAFSFIYPFTQTNYVWQCVLCGFFGFLWIVGLLRESWKKESN